MTTTTHACACHGGLGLTPTAVPDDVLAALGGASIPTLSLILRRLGYASTFLSGVSPRTPGQRFVGRAFTARALPARKDVSPAPPSLHRHAFETLPAGDVLVIDARGDVGARVTGDILATRLKARGAAALVTDGAVGDLVALQTVGLPVYSRGVTPVTFGEVHVMADLDVPIACAGVLVVPGDVLVGDAEGVIVVPQGVAAQVAGDAVETERRDAFSRRKVEAGAPLAQAYPLSGALLAEYEAEQARRRGAS
jgi:regulator of RNase E activity RraA